MYDCLALLKSNMWIHFSLDNDVDQYFLEEKSKQISNYHSQPYWLNTTVDGKQSHSTQYDILLRQTWQDFLEEVSSGVWSISKRFSSLPLWYDVTWGEKREDRDKLIRSKCSLICMGKRNDQITNIYQASIEDRHLSWIELHVACDRNHENPKTI